MAGWQEMVPGAWSYQLPSEPASDYPISVWYRVRFEAGYLPPKLELLVDGFAASEWKLYVNGQVSTAQPVRSALDSQMKAVDISSLVHEGENTLALRLVLTSSTDGLLDLLKLMGDFSLERSQDGGYRLAPPRTTMQPASWTGQGYPFYSGRATFRRQFEFPQDFKNQRIFLEPILTDDVLEVLVNGESAGVRLWQPYQVEVTNLLQSGENTLELRVANTLVNLLERVERPSGLAGAPNLVPYRTFIFDLADS